MAMLAEPRRKQKIGPNPRGKFYGEQDKNFGKELLEKLGWKNGDGLGLERKGITEAIRPKIQMSSKGLGYDPKENPWVEHNREFEEILRGLNTEESITTDIQSKIKVEEYDADADTNQKLENKSKKSRARIHYHKFVQGKDLSRASPHDLRSILGTSVSQEVFGVGSGETSETAVDAMFSREQEKEGNTINKGSMVDYFKRKMDEKRLAATSSLPHCSNAKVTEAEIEGNYPVEESDVIKIKAEELDVNESAIDVKPEKKRKRPKRKTADANVPADEREEELENTKWVIGGSMVDYFKRKMDEKRLAATSSLPHCSNAKVTEAEIEGNYPVEESDVIKIKAEELDVNESAIDVKPEKKRKRHKRKTADANVPADEREEELENTKWVSGGSMVDYFKRKMDEKRLAATSSLPQCAKVNPTENEMDDIFHTESDMDIGKIKVEEQEIKEPAIDVKPEKKQKRQKRKTAAANATIDEAEQELVIEVEKKIGTKRRKKINDNGHASDGQPEENLNDNINGQINGCSDAACSFQPPPETEEITLEEKLKREMENLKNGRHRLKQQYFSSLNTLGKKFKGSNIDKIKGYTIY